MPDKIAFIDIEASSLGTDSYPIQVAWVTTDGASRDFLINPDLADNWVDWDEDAEQRIHRISRDALRRSGVSPERVAEALNQDLAGVQVYSDGRYYDQFWLDKLFLCAGISPSFRLAGVETLFAELVDNPAGYQDFAERVAQIRERAGRMVSGREHDAAHDAARLLVMYQLLSGQYVQAPSPARQAAGPA